MASPAATIFLLLLITVPQTKALPFSHFHTLLSLSHSLTSRVATLRAARGDYAGAARAKQISKTLERFLGTGFIKFLFNIGYDYLKNFSWKRDISSFEMVGDLKELISLLSEVVMLKSIEQRTVWLGRNHRRLIRVSRNLVKAFGPTDVLGVLHKEVVEGELLKDCLEVGNSDLIGIVKVLKDIANNYYSLRSSKIVHFEFL